MRAALINFMPFIFLVLILLCFFLGIKGHYNVKKKSLHFNHVVESYGWSIDAYFMHFGISFFFIILSYFFYTADFGWLVDLACLIGFLVGLLLIIGFSNIEKVFITKTHVYVVPTFGKTKAFLFDNIDLLQVLKGQRSHRGLSQDTYELRIFEGDQAVKLTEIKNVLALIAQIKQKIGAEKVEYFDKNEMEES